MENGEQISQVINLIPFYREIDDSETHKHRKYALQISTLKTAEVSSNGVLFVGGKGKSFVQVFDISKLENISITLNNIMLALPADVSEILYHIILYYIMVICLYTFK